MLSRILLVVALLVFGDAVATTIDLPVPGPALGLLILLLWLAFTGGPDKGLQRIFDGATPYFPLCFVPAAVGVVANLDMVVRDWLAIVTAICVSTGLAIAAVGLMVQTLMTHRDRGPQVA